MLFTLNERPRDFSLRDRIVRFTSPVHSPYPENNVVHAQWFPAKTHSATKKAVVLLPHWNAPGDGHNALSRGFIEVRYIDATHQLAVSRTFRMPPELERADYAVSSNIGRTMDAARQAVIDVRCCFDWLRRKDSTGRHRGHQPRFLLCVSCKRAR